MAIDPTRSFLTDYESTARKKPTALDRAAEYNGQLLEKVDGLKEFIDNLLRRQEREYLKATRTQMSQISLEITHLKQAAAQHDQQAEIQKLKESLNWIRDEAIRMENTCKKLKNDVLHWKIKANSLEDDRNFLEKQLKSVIKEKFAPIKEKETRENPVFPPITRKNIEEEGKITLPNTKSGKYLSNLLSLYRITDPALFIELEKHLTAQERKFEASVEHYKRTMVSEKRRLQAINTTFSSALSTRSELEDVFFDCVKTVRLEVRRRRDQSQHYRSQSQGMEGENLTLADKRKVLELLVENEAVLSRVYELLFPHKGKEKERKKEEELEGVE